MRSFALIAAVLLLATAAIGEQIINIPTGKAAYSPFVTTVYVGDHVTWTNNDVNDHTIVSNDLFSTVSDVTNLNVLLLGGNANNGAVTSFTIQFNSVGLFLFYDRLYAQLDQFNQPIAPGPNGGIVDASGNYGTPMTGVIHVIKRAPPPLELAAASTVTFSAIVMSFCAAVVCMLI